MGNREQHPITFEAISKAFGLRDIQACEVNVDRMILTVFTDSPEGMAPKMEGSGTITARTITTMDVFRSVL